MTASEQPEYSSATYTVFVTGELAEGANLDQVKASLAKLFKLAPERVEKIMCGKPVAIRRGVDKSQASKLVTALMKAGAMAAAKKAVAVGEQARSQQGQGQQSPGKKNVQRHNIQTPDNLPPNMQSQDAVAQNKPPESVKALNSETEKSSITCPRCGHEQAFTTACALCKMDLQLHIKRLTRKEKIRAFQQQV